jgi:GNAT superfamily N-acetyltransferase
MIEEILTPTGLREAFPVMRELRTTLTEAEFVRRVEAQRESGGYRLFALRADDGQIVALAGAAVQENLYAGRHLWLYDLVTASAFRSQGYGRTLLTFLEDFARQQGCERLGLVSGVQRTDAHRFYEEHLGYQRTCYQFEKKLT